MDGWPVDDTVDPQKVSSHSFELSAATVHDLSYVGAMEIWNWN